MGRLVMKVRLRDKSGIRLYQYENLRSPPETNASWR